MHDVSIQFIAFCMLSTMIILSRGSSNYLLEASFVSWFAIKSSYIEEFDKLHTFRLCLSRCQILVPWEQPLGLLLNMVVRSNGTVAVCLALRLQARHPHPGQVHRRDQEAVLCEPQMIVDAAEKGRETARAVRASKTNHRLDQCLRNGAVAR